MAKKLIVLDINSEIREIFANKAIPMHDGVAFLICLYYGISPSYIAVALERRILASGIVSKDYSSDTIIWKINLFEEQETGFEWISECMDLFKEINPERRGVKADVLRRMKKFFVNNPSIRKDDVIKATKVYLKSVSEPIYCKKSHKFIYEQDGTSMLKDYIDRNLQVEELGDIYEDDII